MSNNQRLHENFNYYVVGVYFVASESTPEYSVTLQSAVPNFREFEYTAQTISSTNLRR
jgi:hypothetical protein